MRRHIGWIALGAVSLWEVHQEPNGQVSVHLAKGDDPDVYACLDDLKASLAAEYSFVEAR